MSKTLEIGLEAETSFTIEEKHLASIVGTGLVRVFSTAMMIGGMESAAVKAVQGYLASNLTTVGVHVDVGHKAASPLGVKVRFKARLLKISANGKGLEFAVWAFDENELIGEGLHRRVVVDIDKFESRAQNKLQ